MFIIIIFLWTTTAVANPTLDRIKRCIHTIQKDVSEIPERTDLMKIEKERLLFNVHTMKEYVSLIEDELKVIEEIEKREENACSRSFKK